MAEFNQFHLMHFCNLTYAVLKCSNKHHHFLPIARSRIEWSKRSLSAGNAQYTLLQVRKDLMDEFMSNEVIANLQYSILTTKQQPTQSVLDYALMFEEMLGLLNDICAIWLPQIDVNVLLINERVALDSYQDGMLYGYQKHLQGVRFSTLQDAIKLALKNEQNGIGSAYVQEEEVEIQTEYNSYGVELMYPLRDVRNRRTKSYKKKIIKKQLK